jgi:hypothetical protein
MRNPDAIRLILRIACFLPLAAAPALTNWICTQPPVQRRMARDLDPILDALASGKPIWTSDDMRTLKEGWIARMPAAKDVLILGGSREMEIAAEWFQPRSLFNAAVLGGDMDDTIALFEACLETGKLPREVILDLNPSLTHKNKPADLRPIATHLHHALNRYKLLPPMRFFAEYFSIEQLRRNFWRLREPAWSYSKEPFNRSRPVQPDSSSGWEPQKANPTPEEVEAAVLLNQRNQTTDVLHWRTTSQPSEFDLLLFRRFLDDLQSRGIRITILLAPIHPVAYDEYSKRGGYDETWIRREMASRKIPVVGSYSPAISRVAKSDFYDDVHPRAYVIRRLLTEAGVIGPQR